MKKLLSAMFIVLFILSCSFIFSACNGNEENKTSNNGATDEKGLLYSLNDDGSSYSVIGVGNCTDSDLVIPSTYNSLPITAIANFAFEGCTTVESVTVSVKTIGNSAFLRCPKLKKVIMEDGVEKIGTAAFQECKNLSTVRIPESAISVGMAFHGCDSLEFNLYDNALYLGDEDSKYQVLIKAKDKDITSCVINSETEIIAEAAFMECTNLESMIIPDNITHIDGSIFMFCTRLTSVSIPNSVKSIGPELFLECHNLTDVILPNTIKKIEAYMFKNCYSLMNITIPNGVTNIGYGAFDGCASLESITVVDGVSEIEMNSFSNCTNLKVIAIPNSVTKIHDMSFVACSALNTINFSGTKSQWNDLVKDCFLGDDIGNYTVYCTDGNVTE